MKCEICGMPAKYYTSELFTTRFVCLECINFKERNGHYRKSLQQEATVGDRQHTKIVGRT
jgi:ribosome-binding protein aMBF1 (putative translation factor)